MLTSVTPPQKWSSNFWQTRYHFDMQREERDKDGNPWKVKSIKAEGIWGLGNEVLMHVNKQ